MENSGVAPLMKNGTVHSDSQAKADILSMQVSSVFTIGNANYRIVSVAGVRTLLEAIKPHKATGDPS